MLNFVVKFLRKLRFSDVMSLDFESKMVVNYINRRAINTEANHKQKVSKRRKMNYLQYGCLGFFYLFLSQNLKNFFEENCCKIQNFQNFQKTALYV